MRLLTCAALAAALLSPTTTLLAQAAARTAPAAPAASPWASEFAQFEAADRANPPAPGGVLFVGSSTIRLWQSLASDFPNVRVVNRCFGGSGIVDVVRYADRVVLPYRPRTIVLYAGDNDLAAGRSPADVARDYQSFVARVKRDLPGTRVTFVSIKPSPARAALMPQMREANRLVRQVVSNDTTLSYVDVFTPMLDSAGRPRGELFGPDGLHMNADGYRLWRDILAPVVK